MKVSPVASPNDIRQAPPTDTKARAVAAFNRATASANSQQSGAPPINQNAVSAEDLSAIKAPEPTEMIEETDVNTPVDETVEAAAPVEETPKEDPALSRQFAQLARQERALNAKRQQQETQWRAREEALKAREAAVSQQPKTDMTGYISKDQLRLDPLAVFAEAGLSYDDITQQILTQQPRDPRTDAHIARLEAKLAALEEGAQNTQKSYQEQQVQSYKAAINQISQDAKALVQSDPVAYEAISKTGTVREVVKLIEDTYNKDGILMSVEEAAQQVEDYLVEENYNMATNIQKIKNRMQQASAKSNASNEKTQAPQKQTQMKTLTNATSSSRQLSAKERAILAFKGELKS